MPGAGLMPKDLGTRSWATVGSRAWQGCPTEGPSCWNWHQLLASGSLGGRACDEARPSLARSRKPTFLPAIPCPQSLPPQEMGPRGFLGLVCSTRLAVLRAPPRHEITVQSTDSLGRVGGTLPLCPRCVLGSYFLCGAPGRPFSPLALGDTCPTDSGATHPLSLPAE